MIAKHFFQPDTPAYNSTPPYQVWLQKVERLRRYHPDKHPLTFQPLLWPWPRTQQSNFSQDTPAYEDVPSTQVCFGTGEKPRRYSKNSHILIIQALVMTLNLKTTPQFLCMTLHLIIVQKHTKKKKKKSYISKAPKHLQLVKDIEELCFALCRIYHVERIWNF